MSRLLLSLALLFLSVTLASAQEKKRFTLYATLVENVPVQLSDGSKWHMDKGDTFPVIMYKEQQTKIILQMASANFMISTAQVKVFEEKDLTEAQWATYRNNVTNYLESQARKWKEQAK